MSERQTINGHDVNSPSTLDRRALCPGSGQMELMYHGPDKPNAARDEGTMLHFAANPENVDMVVKDGLTDEQIVLVVACDEVVKSYELGEYKTLYESTHYELEMELLDDFGEIITTGTADVVIVFRQHVVVIDWKFGRVPADINSLQFAAYCAMAMQKFDKPDATAVVFQPRVSRKPIVKDSESLDYIRVDIASIIARTELDGLTLTPTDSGCRYCKAFDACPAVKSTALAIRDVPTSLVPAERAREYYEKAGIVIKAAENIKDAIRPMVIAGEVPGMEAREVQGKRTVPLTRLLEADLSPIITDDELRALSTVPYKALEDIAVKAVMAEGNLTEKAARETFADLIEDHVKRGKPSTRIVLKKEK